jgi:hypothetical protein
MSDDQPGGPFSPRWQLGVTVALLAGFAALVGLLTMLASHGDETVWQRRLYLFSAVEAIVFTAVGWLFGREVHRSSEASARQDAAAARAEATAQSEVAAEAQRKATEEQTKGRALTAAIRHAATTAGPEARSGASEDISLGDEAAPAPGGLTQLQRFAEDLYGS